MFNDRYGLTEAVLSGRKTQTRRPIGEKYTISGAIMKSTAVW
nr:MAG TPA: ASCH domain protein [Caudoviricetes sp.]